MYTHTHTYIYVFKQTLNFFKTETIKKDHINIILFIKIN